MSLWPRRSKRAAYLAFDSGLLALSLAAAYLLRVPTRQLASFLPDAQLFALIFLPLGVALLAASRLHWHKLSTYDSRAISHTGLVSIALTALAALVIFVLDARVPRSVPFIMAAIFLLLSVTARLLALRLFVYREAGRSAPRIMIYGAGRTGIQLLGALEQAGDYRILGFIDDNAALAGTFIKGRKVHHAGDLKLCLQRHGVDILALAVPSMTPQKRAAVLNAMSGQSVRLFSVPSFEALVTAEQGAEALRPTSLDDLLGRTPVDLNLPRVAEAYTGKVVMVTGAGGSIGSELCRQLMKCGISRLVLFEQSEFALYSIEQELRRVARAQGITLSMRLASVMDRPAVSEAIETEGVEVILHAAAYKHVPLIEENAFAGLRNNVQGTQIVAEAALDHRIERFTLISTDKAVRPTNIMGATKRLAELVVQNLAERSGGTVFSMVRFGNVLGSSGSVVPLFERQIREDGPVTVTHPDVTRFFMTIPEASRLVLLAGAEARGGDVFVLDMGEPVRIMDLARSMIILAGRTPRDVDNPTGDIEIKVTGMRPGEKLYEELLIGDNTLPSPHEKILCAQEDTLTELETRAMLRDVQSALDARDLSAVRSLIRTYVKDYGAGVGAPARQDRTEPLNDVI
ncbi:MAG: nucleoside-diphosphate sugar epimerase/dehydratase [Pseudomonadota bacterium]